MIHVVVAGWVLVYGACVATALVRHAQRARAAARVQAFASPLAVLVRPCAGDEPGLAARLARAGGATEVLFAVATDDDGAIDAAREARGALIAAGARARIVVTGARGPNAKADQLAHALDHVDPAWQIVVVADSDVELGEDDVPRLAAQVAGPHVGAVWAPPVEAGIVATGGDAASHAVLNGSLHAFPLLAGIDPGGMVGKLFAVRRAALDDVGGFSALRRHLGEDMELARRLRARSVRVEPASFVARSRVRGRSLGDVLARYARWIAVVRAQRTPLLASYPLLMAPTPLLVAVLGVAVARADDRLLLLAVAGLLVRVVVARAARAAAGTPPTLGRSLVDALVGDAVLIAAWCAALTTRRVRWRDRSLVLGPGGVLEEVVR